MKPMDYNNNYNNPYQQPNHNEYPGQPLRNPGQGMATASMILGVACFFMLFTVYVPIICGSIAILLAILSKGYGKRMLVTARVGIGCAIGGMLLVATIVGVLVGSFFSSSGEDLVNFGRQMDQQFKRQTGQELEDVLGQSYEDLMKTYTEMLGK